MELTKLNDHLYVPTDFEKSHYYFADAEGKKKYTGITTVIGVLAKPALIGWAAKTAVEFVKENGEYDGETEEYTISSKLLEEAKSAHTKKKEAAGTHGTDAHALVEEYINDCIKNHSGRSGVDYRTEWKQIVPFMEWANENVDHFLFAERRMANKDLFLAGTADFACVLKTGQKLIGDFKTSSGIYGIDYYLQCAGYKILAEGEGDEAYDGCVIARLGKDGLFEATYNYDTKTAENSFMACLTLYRAQAALTQVATNDKTIKL